MGSGFILSIDNLAMIIFPLELRWPQSREK